MRTTIIILAAVLLAACGGGDGGGGGGPVGPGPLHVSFVKVGGDGQRAAVKGFSANKQIPHAFRAAVAAGEDSLFPLPLIGRLVLTGGSSNKMPSVPGLHLDALPSNLVVQWNPSDPSCVRGFLTSTLPAADSTVTNRAVRGTKAGTCTLRAVTLVGTEPMAVDSFAFTVDPGPPSATYDTDNSSTTFADSMVVGDRALQDAYGNSIAYTIEAPSAGVPLDVAGHVVRFTGTRDALGRWMDNGGANGQWTLYVLEPGGARAGTLRVTVGGGQPAMWWRATGLGVP